MIDAASAGGAVGVPDAVEEALLLLAMHPGRAVGVPDARSPAVVLAARQVTSLELRRVGAGAADADLSGNAVFGRDALIAALAIHGADLRRRAVAVVFAGPLVGELTDVLRLVADDAPLPGGTVAGLATLLMAATKNARHVRGAVAAEQASVAQPELCDLFTGGASRKYEHRQRGPRPMHPQDWRFYGTGWPGASGAIPREARYRGFKRREVPEGRGPTPRIRQASTPGEGEVRYRGFESR